MEIDNTLWILDYLEEIHAGRIDAPKRVTKQYEQLVPILEGKDSRWGYNPRKAYAPICFAETNCRQSKDEWRGQPIKYLLWQKAALSAIYGIVDRETGLRKFQKIFILIGKKNGKTTMMSPVALYETSRSGNEVISAANALMQSKIIWQEAANMLEQSPNLATVLKKRQFDIKNIRKYGFSTFAPVANSPNILDGRLPKVVILDEIHELYQDIYDILYNGQVSIKDPLFFMLTTKGYVREGLFDTEYANSTGIIDGVVEDERKFSLLYELDDPEHWENDEHWQQANPSLGYILTTEKLREIVKDAQNKPASLNAVKVKHFNCGGVSGDAYFPLDAINNESEFDLDRLKDREAIGGFDLSSTNDMTAFSTLVYDREAGEFLCETMYWITEDFYADQMSDSRMANTWRIWVDRGLVRLAGRHTIDHSAVVRYAMEMVETWGIYYRWIYYDPWSATYLVREFNEAGFREDECLRPTRQGAKTLSVPFQALEAQLRAKRINYRNNPVMKWNMTNVDVVPDRNGNLLPKKAGDKNKRKIDGFATLLDCFVGVCEHAQEMRIDMT